MKKILFILVVILTTLALNLKDEPMQVNQNDDGARIVATLSTSEFMTEVVAMVNYSSMFKVVQQSGTDVAIQTANAEEGSASQAVTLNQSLANFQNGQLVNDQEILNPYMKKKVSNNPIEDARNYSNAQMPLSNQAQMQPAPDFSMKNSSTTTTG